MMLRSSRLLLPLRPLLARVSSRVLVSLLPLINKLLLRFSTRVSFKCINKCFVSKESNVGEIFTNRYSNKFFLIRQSLLLPSLDTYRKLNFVLDQGILLVNPFGLTYQILIFLIVLVGYVEIFFIIIVDLLKKHASLLIAIFRYGHLRMPTSENRFT
jgi:hypothetical protein